MLVCMSLAGCASVRGDAPAITVDSALEAPGIAPAPLHHVVHLPPGYDANARRRYPVLYVNDGQDREAVGLDDTLQRLYREGRIVPVIVVSIDMPPDRMAGYGLSDRAGGRSLPGQSRHGAIGANAHVYAEWLARRLVPHIDRHYRTQAEPQGRAILGWSLGALQAFDMGWQYPDVFGTVGAFSPSFWLPADAGAAQSSRLAQQRVASTTAPVGTRWWFSVGTQEETDDRDADGVNDAMDDVRDLVLGYRDGDRVLQPGLAQRGYAVDVDPVDTSRATADVVLWHLDGGRHEQAAWRRMFPLFLEWADGVRRTH